LFKNKRFSVKNYSSRTKSLEINLGHSLLGKSIPGALYALGYDRQKTKAIFYNGIRHPEKSATHFYHLQYGFELMGLGLKDIKNKDLKEAKEVDFFIYNDPSSDNIYVKSTA
jgi:hypothetical protein